MSTNAIKKKAAIIEATLFDLKQVRRSFNPLSSVIDVIDNGSKEIINEYFDTRQHLARLIELIEREEVRS
jgi:hypothetical protein